MEILLITATEMEMQATVGALAEVPGHRLHRLVTGPGMMATAFALGQVFEKHSFDLAIQAGIAGSFSSEYPVGTLVEVHTEVLADFGAEDGNKFLSAFDIPLLERDCFPFTSGMLMNPGLFKSEIEFHLPQVKGITVNTVHGNDASIDKVLRQFSPEVETMEGAAFFYACLKAGVPFLEIRAISNRVEKRDRKRWNIPLALQSLHEFWENWVHGFQIP